MEGPLAVSSREVAKYSATSPAEHAANSASSFNIPNSARAAALRVDPAHHGLVVTVAPTRAAVWTARLASSISLGAAAGVACVALAVGQPTLLVTVSVLVSMMLLGTLGVVAAYVLDPQLYRVRALQHALARWKQAFDVNQEERRTTTELSIELRAQYQSCRAAVDSHRHGIEAEFAPKFAWLSNRLRRAQDVVATRRKHWEREVAQVARRLAKEHRKLLARRLNRVEQCLASTQHYAAERLQLRQKQALQTELATFTIQAADLPGIGDKLKHKLASVGIRSAAECDADLLATVEGCGQKRAQQLLDWRGALEAAVRNRLPVVLGVDDLELLRSEHHTRLHTIEEEHAMHMAYLRGQSRQLREQYEAGLLRLSDTNTKLKEFGRLLSEALTEQRSTLLRTRVQDLMDSGVKIRSRYRDSLAVAETARRQVQESRTHWEQCENALQRQQPLGLAEFLRLVFAWPVTHDVPPSSPHRHIDQVPPSPMTSGLRYTALPDAFTANNPVASYARKQAPQWS